MKSKIGVSVHFFMCSTLNEGTYRGADFRPK